MPYQLKAKGNTAVGYWLMLGVFMIIVQVILGGITRLTQSGLSITDWDVIAGILPPMNKAAWMEAFNAYKQIPQYEILNEGMSLGEFKWIYFWEYIHRLWARTIGSVFLFPLIYFIVKGKIEKVEIPKYLFILLLGGMQGAMGWIMVASGLENRVFVDPVKLMFHLILAVALLILVYRLALENLDPAKVRLYDKGLRKVLTALLIVIIIQICLGALVAGSRAALAYPTWPKMGNAWVPNGILAQKPIWKNLVENLATMQFLHRIMAYILAVFSLVVFVKFSKVSASTNFHRNRKYLIIAIFIQLLLGILTLINSKLHIPVTLGVLHQFVAMVTVLIVTSMHYSYKYG